MLWHVELLGKPYTTTHISTKRKNTNNTTQQMNCVCMDTWALDSQFCKVQNKLSILKIGDSSVYIALLILFKQNFGNHFAQACLSMKTTIAITIECVCMKRQCAQHKRNVDQIWKRYLKTCVFGNTLVLWVAFVLCVAARYPFVLKSIVFFKCIFLRKLYHKTRCTAKFA